MILKTDCLQNNSFEINKVFGILFQPVDTKLKVFLAPR
jgi:hypothetical protein